MPTTARTTNLCTCTPHVYAKATPVLYAHEIDVIDPDCRHHRDGS